LEGNVAGQIVIPKLGMTMTSAHIVEWKAEEGEWVEKGGVVLVLETAKVKYDLEADASGFLHIIAEKGAEVPVGKVVGFLAGTKEELEDLQKEVPLEIPVEDEELREASRLQATSSSGDFASKAVSDPRSRVSISPLARKMAEEHMIDVSSVTGSGPVEDFPPDIYQGKRVKARIPLKGMSKSIAEHMYRSLSDSAQVTFFGEFNATNLVRLRQDLLTQEKIIDVRITYTDILVFGISRAIRDHLDINCSLIDGEIMIWKDINIGVAVALGKEGLIVPVIKNADQKSLLEISKEGKALVEKARSEKLLPDEVTGGTFTLSSIGAVGVTYFQTPIINQPESAILATGPIIEKPVVRDGEIVIAPVMNFSLTFDHRVINGFGAEQFLGRVGALLENPNLLLL
jgi:pyruvate dehydrogenase E2 component (dihydrolipoamide acetyltransferase)